MKLKLAGFKSRHIPEINLIVERGQEFEVKKELAEALLKQNTKDFLVWERVQVKQGDK